MDYAEEKLTDAASTIFASVDISAEAGMCHARNVAKNGNLENGNTKTFVAGSN